ncbi:XK-related protein 6 [Halotydeus destructor]|nr:XK-related protein 6 [Halotydeus destructor]
MAAELKDETGLELCPRISIVSPSRRSQDGGLCRQPRSKLLLQRLHKGGDTIVPYDFPQSSENGQSPRSPASFDFDKDDRLPSNHVSPRRNSAKFSPCARPSISSHRISFSNHSESHDRIDALPKEMTFTWIDVFAILFSIGSFLFDIGMDMIVASLHYRNGDYWYFTLTTTFIVIPTLIMTGISMRWYVLDSREEGSPPVSPLRWIFRIFFLLLQLGPILRYIDSLVYGFKFRRANRSRKSREGSSRTWCTRTPMPQC